MKRKINDFLKFISIGLLFVFLISGCGKTSVTQSLPKKEEETELEKEDQRIVPEFKQVEEGLKSIKEVVVNQLEYSSSEVITHKQDAFEVSVDELRFYSVKQADKAFTAEFNYENQAGGIVLMHVMLKNTSNQTFYYPIEELRLTYQDASVKVLPSERLYPLETGNLYSILKTNKGEMNPGDVVEGYLVYGLGKTSMDRVVQNGSYYLTVLPPQASQSDMVGVSSTELGTEAKLFLPANSDQAKQITENSKLIPDRLVSEWWGNKTLLAKESMNDKQLQEEVEVKLNRMEIADFVPFKEYEDSFQNFIHGTVIVTAEFEVTNNGKEDLLPIDGTSDLTINGEPINDDYVLINESFGHVVKPGETYRFYKAYALDKKHYQETWQGNEYEIHLNVPIKSQESNHSSDGDSGLESISDESSIEEQNNVSEKSYLFGFKWKPTLELLVNDKLELVKELEESTESESVQADIDSTESQEESFQE